jgi:NAD(P)-dependent dehydrogenase (short-subunit alcohol dehydrogenase family)
MTAKGKTVLITGSTDGVGRYVAERLAAQGWRVIVHGRDRTRGEAVVERITQQGGEARFLAADLASLAEVRSLAGAVRRDGDGLDALINNAGIGTSGARRELQRRRFRIALRGQLSRGLPADAAAAANADEPKIRAHS